MVTFDLRGWMSRRPVAAGGRRGLDACFQKGQGHPVCGREVK